MRKHGGTPSRRDKHVTLAAISPPGVARGRFVGGQQSGLAGSKPPPLFTREASSCSSQGRRQGEPWGAPPRPSAPTYLPTWLNEQERVDAPQVAAKRSKSIKLQHDGRGIRLRDWRDFRGQYTLFGRNVEDWNEGDEQARLLSMLPEAWIKRVTKEEAERAKSNHTVKKMLPKEYHTNVVAWRRKNVARDVKPHSLRNALLITVSGDREKTAMCRLDECDVSGQTILLQDIPARMSCDEILEWVGEEVLKEYRNLHHTRGLRPGDRDVNYVGEGPGGEAAMDPAGADGNEALVDDNDNDEPAEMAVCAFVTHNGAGNNQGSWKPLQPGWKKKEV